MLTYFASNFIWREKHTRNIFSWLSWSKAIKVSIRIYCQGSRHLWLKQLHSVTVISKDQNTPTAPQYYSKPQLKGRARLPLSEYIEQRNHPSAVDRSKLTQVIDLNEVIVLLDLFSPAVCVIVGPPLWGAVVNHPW